MTTRNKLIVAAALCGALSSSALIGCGGDDEVTPGADAGTQADMATAADTGTGPVTVEDTIPTDLPALSIEGGTIDLSCQGVHTAPTATGTAAGFTLAVKDFQTGNAVPGAKVHFFADNAIPTDPTAGTIITADSSGNAAVSAIPGSWYGYYIEGNSPSGTSTTVPSIQINETTPTAGGTATGNSVSQATVSLIPLTVGRMRATNTAMLSGTVYDCNEKPVQGAVVRAFNAAGDLIAQGTTSTSTIYAYFGENGLPTSNEAQPYSNTNGLYGALNVPIANDGDTVRVETWAIVGGEPTMIGCESLRMFKNVVAIVNVMPQRADGPSNCSNSVTTQ
jgi:hypothetical protein